MAFSQSTIKQSNEGFLGKYSKLLRLFPKSSHCFLLLNIMFKGYFHTYLYICILSILCEVIVDTAVVMVCECCSL